MRPTLLLLAFLLCTHLFAQDFSRARIHLDEGRDLVQLAALGLDVEHGEFKPGHYFVSDFSQRELQRIRSASFPVDILIEDVQRFYVEQNAATAPPPLKNLSCHPSAVEEVPTPEHTATSTTRRSTPLALVTVAAKSSGEAGGLRIRFSRTRVLSLRRFFRNHQNQPHLWRMQS